MTKAVFFAWRMNLVENTSGSEGLRRHRATHRLMDLARNDTLFGVKEAGMGVVRRGDAPDAITC